MLFSCCTNFLPCDNKSLPYFCVDFYLRPPRGGRSTSQSTKGREALYFYPRPPRGGRLDFDVLFAFQCDFYPRPPRGGRPESLRVCGRELAISIHALREEGDVKRSHLPGAGDNFYPRPPRGGRQVLLWFVAALMDFLSTPSARRAMRGGVGFMLFK